MDALQRFAQIRQHLIDQGVTLVAVSKFRTPDEILARYQLGQRDFGENRVQELLQKRDQLPADIRWHLIGHLQTNKVRAIVPFVHLIHSGDRLKLLRKINDEATRIGRIVPVLLQAKVAQEETKHGFRPDELADKALLDEIRALDHVRISGLMGMASLTPDRAQVRDEFQRLKDLYDRLAPFFGTDFRHLSMGMSGDYELAIEAGANMVRLGSILFAGPS